MFQFNINQNLPEILHHQKHLLKIKKEKRVIQKILINRQVQVQKRQKNLFFLLIAFRFPERNGIVLRLKLAQLALLMILFFKKDQTFAVIETVR
ncbi:hypothetical protein NUSPORA_02969 [Nucleospora cyclopteri]